MADPYSKEQDDKERDSLGLRSPDSRDTEEAKEKGNDDNQATREKGKEEK